MVLWAALSTLAIAAPLDYESTVAQAEKLWNQGDKPGAVRLYGSVWRLKPDDVDRQILYGNRSAEVYNFRWSLNFFKVAESNAAEDPTRLREIYSGYARTYQIAGNSIQAKAYEAKAAALARGESVPAKRGGLNQPDEHVFGYYTERPPDTWMTPDLASSQKYFLKRRLHVAPVEMANGRSGDAPDDRFLQTSLVAELEKTGRFVLSGPREKASSQFRVELRVTDAGLQQAAEGRRGGPGGGRGGRALRLAANVRLVDEISSRVVFSRDVRVQSPMRGGDPDDLPQTGRGGRGGAEGPLAWLVDDLVGTVTGALVDAIDGTSWQAPVDRVAGSDVYLGAGGDEGLRAGDRFRVFSREASHAGGEGEAAFDANEVCEVTVMRVEPTFSIARIVERTGQIKAGDIVVLE